MNNSIFGGVRLLYTVIVAALLLSCNKDENLGRLNLSSSIARVDALGATTTVGFTYSELHTLSVTSKPRGWEIVADIATKTITVTAPATIEVEDEADNDISGMVTIVGRPTEGALVSVSLFVGIIQTEDLSAMRSNSFVVSKKNTYYTFDGTYKGETSERLATASVSLIWQSSPAPLQYVEWKDEKVGFYVGENKTKKMEGNALIGAYNDAGTLIWSWHIWIAEDYDPKSDALTYTNGYTVMSRNLGAMKNANSTEAEILSSYGLYYQWGRKEPFIGPNSYNAAKGVNASIFNAAGSRAYLTEKQASATTGTAEYALQNPLCFLTGVEESGYDWLYAAHDATRWSDRKTVNDPCPKGWRVPSTDVFTGLSIADKSGNAAAYENKYGWMLTDGTTSSLYMGLGRRRYDNGKILNVYNPLPKVRNEAIEAQPWEGLYWTTDAVVNDRSSAFYFFFDKSDVQASSVEYGVPHYRANGMQIRCVMIGNR